MTVMVLCHFDETNPFGGLEKQAGRLAAALRRSGENVVLLASTRKRANAGWRTVNGVPVRLFWTFESPALGGRHLPAALLWAVQVFAWIYRWRDKTKIVHGHQIRIHAFAGALARRLLNIPLVLKSASGGPSADIKTIGSRKYFGPLGRRFVNAATDRFVATTASIADDLKAFGVPASKISVIPNGVEVSGATVNTPAEMRRRRFVFLGRMARDKNVIALARAAAQVVRQEGVTLTFIGEGEDEQAVREIAAGHPEIECLGFLETPEPKLAEYGYLFLPSNSEGLSNAMLEAMTRGVAPVAARVSGCVDYIDPGRNGFFLDGVDEASIVEGLRRAARTPIETWEQWSRAASKLADSEFSMESVVLKYKMLYRDLL